MQLLARQKKMNILQGPSHCYINWSLESKLNAIISTSEIIMGIFTWNKLQKAFQCDLSVPNHQKIRRTQICSDMVR